LVLPAGQSSNPHSQDNGAEEIKTLSWPSQSPDLNYRTPLERDQELHHTLRSDIKKMCLSNVTDWWRTCQDMKAGNGNPPNIDF